MISQEKVNGHAALVLQNEYLRAVVLPEKGADICELHYLPAGVQCLMATPAGLQPPDRTPVQDFLENYEGGWQELFPNANDAASVQCLEVPFHGEVCTLPWEYQVLCDDDHESLLHLRVSCRRTPFRLERWMRLRRSSRILEIEGQVTNTGNEELPFVWGQHLVLGGDFLENGCQIETPAQQIITLPELFEPATARLAPGQDERWPLARGRQEGVWIDMQKVPGPEAHSHDDAFLGGFERGWLAVTNPRLKLRFILTWDEQVYRWLTFWQPYGGADLPPLTGIYGLGIEPWVWRGNLAQAVENGGALWLKAGEALRSWVQVGVETSSN